MEVVAQDVQENIDNENITSEVKTENPAQTESNPAEGTQIEQPQKPEDVIDWAKDNRYEKSWAKDPNKLYKSYRDMETAYAPLKKQYETLNKTFQELEIAPENLKDILGELNQWKDPNNLTVQRANYISSWLDNPMYQPAVVNFFNELEKQDLSRKYPGMNEEQIKKMVELEEKVNTLNKVNEEREYNSLVTQNVQDIDSGIADVKKLAEARGFQVTPDIEKYLLDHCDKNQVNPKYLVHEFMKLYSDQLDKSYAEKIEKDVLARVSKQKTGVVIPAKGTTPAPAKFSFKESALKLLKK